VVLLLLLVLILYTVVDRPLLRICTPPQKRKARRGRAG